MSIEYQAVQWNRQKRQYDAILIGGLIAFIALFCGLTKVWFPQVTDEILILRATGAAAFTLLHGILCIGPLCRLNPSFLPLLYNRRHAGVALCFLGLIHAALVIATYHAGGNLGPLQSIFQEPSIGGKGSLVPFQWFGFFALLILVLMASTSHDFWLVQLTAPVWKSLHMLVYAAYAFLVVHVALGILQSERHLGYFVLLATGSTTVLTLHAWAALRGRGADAPIQSSLDAEGYLEVCGVDEIPMNRAKVLVVSGEKIAIFRYQQSLSAVSNLCQHQNGPLGEGKIVDGCITCPWHGYQYFPHNGSSPPPFVEKVPTFHVRVRSGRVWVHPNPHPPGTALEPAQVEVPSSSMTCASNECLSRPASTNPIPS